MRRGTIAPVSTRAAATQNTADEVIKAQDKHLKDTVAAGDTTHEAALNDMKGRWKHPVKGMGWYKSTKREFADLPED